jgi:hypothetical protein
MEPTHEEDDLSFLDEKTGSKHTHEFSTKSEVRLPDGLSDDEIMEILQYALRINR